MELKLKTSSFILISLLIILNNNSHCDVTDDDCKSWNEYCKRARSQTSRNEANKNFQCIDDVVYFYEPESIDWDEARHVCNLKFGGTYLADLVQIPDNKEESSTKTMLGNLGIINQDIATSGICCFKKLSDQTGQPDGAVCEWLPTGKKVPDGFTSGSTAEKCHIVTISFDGSNLKGSATLEKSGASLPFLCSFNYPDGCPPIARTTTTTAPGSTGKSSPTSNNKQTDTTQSPPTNPTNPTNPSDKPKDTTVSTSETSLTNETDIDQHLEDIHNELHLQGLDSEKLLKISKRLKDLLNEHTMEKSSSLELTMDIVYKIENHTHLIENYHDKLLEFSNNMMESVSRVLDAHYAWDSVNDTSKRISMSSNILQYIQKTGFIIGCHNETDTNTGHKIVKPNIIVKTFTMDFKNGVNFNVSGKDSSISVPAGIPDPIIPECKEGIVVGAMFDKLSRYLSDHIDQNHEINSKIVAFSIENNEESTPLPDDIPPVRIVVEHNHLLEWGDRVDCVYWDFNEKNWSTNGCRFIQYNSNRRLSICECNHLTNFAAIMDVSGRETDTKLKDILTKVCCGLSILCLILTIGSLTLVRALRNRRNNITSNLCFCLLIVNLLVVFGMDSTQTNWLCQTVTAFLLYFILCSFSWMLMEGYHLYQMIVLVFSNVGHLRLLYLYAIGYGAPLLIAFSAYLGIGFKNLKESDSYFCWISSPSHPYRVWAVAGPASVAIAANGLIMFLALKEAFSAKVKKKLTEKDFNSDTPNIAERLSQSFSWIKGFISLVVVLGITWISFLLYIHQFGQFFSYIFIVLNGLQGVFIFIFQILLNDKARSVVRKSCQKRIPSRYLSSLYRTTSTNVFTSMRSKSISRDKSSTDNTNTSNSGRNNGNNRKTNDANNSTIGSHRSQSISMNRIRNASDSILF